jgi:quinol monooxygenase YgiN
MNTVTIEPKDDVAAIIAAFRTELADPAKPFALLVRFAVEATGAQRIATAFAEATPLTLMEAGCRSFHPNREARNPNRFVVYERWQSLADLEAHLRMDYIHKLRGVINELIVGAPEFHVLMLANDDAV